jgi:tetratricopeptide (TPR) repeat protein
MEKNQDIVKDLPAQVQLIKGEVDALQIAVMKQHTPWHKNIPTIISVLALLFSFGTTYVSYNHTKAQDMQNLKSELRSILQRLASLPKEDADLMQKYADDPIAIGYLSSYVTQENSLLARQAAEIAQKLPMGQVSATEYFAVGLALANSYNVEGAIKFQQQAIKVSNDFNDELAALRTYACLLFLREQPEAGRVEYQKALNIFSRYKNYNDYTQKSAHIGTELNWAASEANCRFMDLANQHITNAENLVSTLSPNPGTEQLKNQITQTKSRLNADNSTANIAGGFHQSFAADR